MNKIRKVLTSIFLISMLVTITTITTVGIANAVPIIEWEKTYFHNTYPGTFSNFLFVQQTSDGGYIATGSIGSEFEEWYYESSGLAVKVDKYGNKQWDIEYGQSDDAYHWSSNAFSSIQQTTDGGYIIAGYVDEVGYDSDALLMKTDSKGKILWNKTFGRNFDSASSVRQTTDGGYILTGLADSNTDPYGSDAFLIKTNSNGNKLWNKTFEKINTMSNVQQTKDGGYILTGTSYAYNRALLIKTDSNGNKLWNKTFGAMNSEVSNVQQTTDEGYIIAGTTSVYPTIYTWLIKTDNNGNKLWNKTFRGGTHYIVNHVQQTTEGGYILTGSISTYNNNTWLTNALLIKTDNNGNKLWNKTFGKNTTAEFVQQTKDGGYILTGQSGDTYDDWLVKLGPDKPVNILKNPGFEESYNSLPRYWNKYQTGTKALFTYPEIGRTGTGKSVAIKYATKESGKVALWWQQSIPVIPLKQYKLSGYMKLSNVTGGGAYPRYNGADLRINWYKSDGGLIKVDLITKSGTIGWTRYEKTFTSPSNAVKATVGGDLFNASGKVWFDDMSFVRIS